MSSVVTLLPLVLVALVLALVVGRRLGGMLGRLLPLAVVVRFLGSTARYEVIERFYNGVGDSKRYFAYGAIHARDIARGDFSFLAPLDHGHWWGTRFIEHVSAFVIVLVGENIRAGFFVFALFSLTGLALTVLAFRNSGRDERRYAYWLLLWPSLCFWPTSMGKDAVMIFALGLCVYGYVGVKGKIKPFALLLGIGVATCIRPHIAVIISFALLVAELPKTKTRTSKFRRMVVIGVGITTAMIGLSQFGLDVSDLEGIQERFETDSSRTLKGGSAIGATTGILAIPMAFVNSLMRPFPWEAHHVFALFASLEVWAFWLFVLVRRRALRKALRDWRGDRMMRIGFPLGILLAFFYGMAMSNLGIIARQRVVILPFLFILVSLRLKVAKRAHLRRPRIGAVR